MIKKKMTFAAAALAASLLMPVGASAESQTKTQDDMTFSEQVEQSWENFKDFTVEQKDAAIAAGRDMIAAIDRQIEKLTAESEEATDEIKAENSEEISRLEKLRDSIAEQLEAAGEATADTWDAFKEAVGDAVESVRETFRDEEKVDETKT
ncbi:hypothetical protein [Minwuia sp.]|uniref:hypothetical protein n=1 Tax=Minwuia sp. TaxID=2493630 RepID=UPI003A91F97B